MYRRGALRTLGVVFLLTAVLWSFDRAHWLQWSSQSSTRARILIIHKRLPDLTTGCDRRLLALVQAFHFAGADVTYLSMPVSMVGMRPSDDIDTCLAMESSAADNDFSLKEPPTAALALSAELTSGSAQAPVSWMEIHPRNVFGDRQSHFCQRLKMLVHGVGVKNFDAILVAVWFWPFGGLGGSQHHSLAHQILPALRLFFQKSSSPSPKLVSISDDAFSARQLLLSRTEVDITERKRMETAAAVIRRKEMVIYGAVDYAAFISSEDRDLSFERQFRERNLITPTLILLRPNVRVVAATTVSTSIGHADRKGLVFLGSGAVETNYQGIQWFLNNCWKTLRERVPGLTFTIIGKPPSTFSACRKREVHCTWTESTPFHNRTDSGVTTAGFLDADKLVEVLSQARVFIEPIVSSTGINTKAFTGFEHDLPVLMTTPAASGLHLENFPVPNTVPPDESAFVGAVLQLHENATAWEEARRIQRKYITALSQADLGRRDAVTFVHHIESTLQ